MRWKRADPQSRRCGRQLVRESEVYLSGHYAAYLNARHRVVPEWAWLNVLAHGSHEQLCSLAVQPGVTEGVPRRTRIWWQAVGYLAGEILARRNEGRDLDDLRRSVLVPLELACLASGELPGRPDQLVRAVLDALDR